jgi:octaprenyl-diphosphate synthase
MAVFPFHDAVADEFASVNKTILNQLHSNVDLVENIGHYIVDAGGKRLRPLLVLLVAKALGYSGKHHIEMAAIIEFIHTATLLHDDVVDLSQLRRGRETANAKWGNAPSVLVGDFLYSRAFQMLVTLQDLHIMSVMANATNIIAEGEVLQLVHAGDASTNESHYRRVIACKTAQLFEAATQCAAILSGADTATEQELARYGHHLGMAFQLIDDVLDYSGSAEIMGKNLGDDLAEGKPTLPLIYSLLYGSTDEANTVRHAIEKRTAENLPAIIRMVQDNGALAYTREAAMREVESALACLDALPDNRFRNELASLARFAVTRQS